jgi:hypothetical protein
MNPYTQFLTDEASGLEYINPKWEVWEEGKREGRREVVEWVDQNSNKATISLGEYTYETRHPNQLFTDLGDWQEQKAKWGLK